ncbi:hypothetical protein CDD83_9459 [Cordyceps sp. RAO-2017]|nr:hypothetical protein CDD83_9459 [Cordyceps sp. RAO-2017]
MPPEAAKHRTVHKIHILGNDESSKYIAHALSGVYDSVEHIGDKAATSSKYRNIQTPNFEERGRAYFVERSSVEPQTVAQADRSRIDELVVTGEAHEAVRALQSVKNRVDDKTTVCLMTAGLGVLDDVKRKIFEGSQEKPNFVLGHMSHRLVFHRKHNSVKALKNGDTRLTRPDLSSWDGSRGHEATEPPESPPNLVKSWQDAKDLRSSMTTYDRWLHFKLPSVLFDSVVEPVCVLLDTPYKGLLNNRAAQRVMYNLITEILSVVDRMPEVANSEVIRNFTHGTGVRRFLFTRILAKRSQPSRLNRLIEYGLPNDIEYLNGYFLRRAKKLGLEVPVNRMIRDMVKAKQAQAIKKLNSHVPIEETSIPSHMADLYRTSAR